MGKIIAIILIMFSFGHYANAQNDDKGNLVAEMGLLD